MTLGEKIKALRKRKYTQEELAYRLGVHVNTLLKWEHGYRKPTADKLKALADILGTTPSELLSTDDIVKNSESVNVSETMSDSKPYTQKQVNNGMLVYTLNNGARIELPPIKDSYDFLRDIALHAAHVAVV